MRSRIRRAVAWARAKAIKPRARADVSVLGVSDVPQATAPADDRAEEVGLVEPWRLSQVMIQDGSWTMKVTLPWEHGIRTAALVLVGRTSRHEVAMAMEVAGGTASGLVPESALARFGSETLDVSIEFADGDQALARRRIGLSDGLSPAALQRASRPGVRWYGTVNRNLSVEVSPPVADQIGLSRPRLVAFAEDDETTDLMVEGITNGMRDPVLVLVGRRSRLELSLPFAERGTTWHVGIRDEDLMVFGAEHIQLFVGEPQDDGTQSRIQLATRVEFETRPGALRRWYATTEGNVGLRRPTPVESISEAGVFDVDYYLSQVPDLPAEIDPIEHYVMRGADRGLNPSKMFETSYYRKMNPDIRRNPLAHYCEYGWKELRNPSPLFNTWWYWCKNLDLSSEAINPLAHYETVGKHEGYSTRPDPLPSRTMPRGHRLGSDQPVRRLCLFAGYDRDGIVDDYVLAYVQELAKHADVYYLADSTMSDTELDKLSGHTVGAWAQRHGEYDFGSYSRLIDRLGWDAIEEYDELLLVNDSGYLLRPLDQVFAQMDEKSCDWWGLQATKGTHRTRLQAVNQFRDPIPMDSVRSALIDGFERDYVYDFHLGSYFLAFRAPVVRDPEFRRYISSVSSQEQKRHVVYKYEVGLTRWLIQHGHPFDTFISKLFPFHPIYTEWYFRLLDEGFPLLKRYLLSENHYEVTRLADWADRVRAKVPDADVTMFERNLTRVIPPEQLMRSLNIGAEGGVVDLPVPERLLSPDEFREADLLTPKHARWWAFPVCDFTHEFSGNERAIFEEVKDDPSIKKIVLTRDRPVTVDGVNVEIIPINSPEAQHRLMRSGTILIKHSRHRNAVYPLSSELHNLIQVWHGIPFKRIGYASGDFQGVLEKVGAEQSQYRAVISSSKIDSLAMTAAFYPLTFHQVWNTGLPRNDFILRTESELPTDLQAELAKLRALIGDRKLVLFLPTFRNSQSGYYWFTPTEIEWLGRWLVDNNCVLGIREHMADTARTYSSQLSDLPTVDLSDAEFVNVEMLYRVSSALITDYSSAFIDYMLTGKPMVSFAYDYESYMLERGSFYDLDLAFPGPICRSFSELQAELDALFRRVTDEMYDLKRRIFFDQLDDRSSSRVAEKIKDLSEVRGVGKWPGERAS